MIGDVLLIEERHHKAAEEIYKRLMDKNLKKFMIAIGGESGTGKSEIAHLLRRKFKNDGILSKVIHIDNYYSVPPKDRTAWRKANGVEMVGYNEYDWDMINATIKAFKNGYKAVIPFIDIVTDQIDQLSTDFSEIDVLLFEGLYALAAEADFKAMIDMTYHDTKKAQILRGKEAQTEFRTQILEREHHVVQSLRNRANLLITKEMMEI